jgi:two-component system, cell cycle sensor histidine kinase and response regulator CckA
LADAPNNPRRKVSILAIDDDAGTRQLLEDVLTREGYEVRTADSGELGLALVVADPPDLILVDIRMPGMGGPEFCRRIKRAPIGRHIPIMILSGSSGLKDQLASFEAGAVDFVLKPFHRKVLLSRVQTHLELNRLRLQIEQGEERTRELTRANEHLRRAANNHWKAEVAWRESETSFRKLADAAPLMICAYGPDRLATFFNKSWLEFRGRSLEQELGRGWVDGLHPDDRESCLATQSLAFDARRDYRLECRLRRADGEYRWVLWTGAPLYQPGRVFVGCIGSCVDITESRRNQEERLVAQKAESLGVLAAGIAHDFNNLLGVIYAEADLALSRLDSGLPARDHIQNINSVATRAAGIVDLLATYAASGTAPAVEAVDLSAAVEETLRLMRILLASRHLSVICRLGANLPPARANGQQVRRIIMNLLTNAAEVLENEGGSITVSTALIRVRRGESAPANLAEGNYVSLVVSDTGPGISGETLARAMDTFFTTKAMGRGMGMAVVQGIVRSHGGAIRVANSTGQGSTFEVLLPCAAERVVETADAPTPEVLSLRPTGLLLVEDDRALRREVGEFLKRRGVKVVSASQGREALDKLSDPTQKIDVVLLDLSLPDMSGFEVLAEIRKLKPDVKIVLTSTHDLDLRNPGMIEDASRPTVIQKPYRLNELLLVLGKEIESGVMTADPRSERQAAQQ